MSKDDIIELEGDDGSTFQCQLLDIISYGEKEYGVLLNLATKDPVLMEFVERGDSGVFRCIEDDAEFEAVAEYVRALAENA
jgi:hypothetical protein